MRGNYTEAVLRSLARRCSNAAKTGGGVTLQIVRDCVLRFYAEGPDGLISCQASDEASILHD